MVKNRKEKTKLKNKQKAIYFRLFYIVTKILQLDYDSIKHIDLLCEKR